MKSLCFNLIMASNIGNSLNNSATRVILRQQGKNPPIFFALNLAFHLENEIQSTLKFLLKWKRTAAKDTDICVFMEIAKNLTGFMISKMFTTRVIQIMRMIWYNIHIPKRLQLCKIHQLNRKALSSNISCLNNILVFIAK